MENEVYGKSIKEMQEKCGEQMLNEEFLKNLTKEKAVDNKKLVLIIQGVILAIYTLLAIKKDLKGDKKRNK